MIPDKSQHQSSQLQAMAFHNTLKHRYKTNAMVAFHPPTWNYVTFKNVLEEYWCDVVKGERSNCCFVSSLFSVMKVCHSQMLSHCSKNWYESSPVRGLITGRVSIMRTITPSSTQTLISCKSSEGTFISLQTNIWSGWVWRCHWGDPIFSDQCPNYPDQIIWLLTLIVCSDLLDTGQ